MTDNQPEASTSAASSPRRSHNLGTFVFDSSLTREAYTKLIEPNGAIHKLVQRLMEKHGGEDKVRLSLVIKSPPSSPLDAYRQDYGTPSFFLTSLPKLKAHFSPNGAGTHKEPKWPRFSDDSNVSTDESAVIRSRKEELQLLQGVVHGLEMLDWSVYPYQSESPPQSWSSLLPSSARSMLDTMYTPPRSPPSSPSSRQKYLAIISAPSVATKQKRDAEWKANWNGLDWTAAAELCRENHVKCSVIICGAHTPNDKDSTAVKRLKVLCKDASQDVPDELWFTPPPNTTLLLSGYTIEQIAAASPPTGISTAGSTENLVTPSSQPGDASTPSTLANQKQQMFMQQQALRLLQAQAGRQNAGGDAKGGVPQMTPALIASLMTAAKNGQIDMNNPAFQQFKHLIMLQQQQKQSQMSANPSAAMAAAAASGTAGHLPPGITPSNVEQMIQAAVKSQQLAQQAGQGFGQGHNGAGMGNNPPPPQASNQASQVQTPANKSALWSGDLLWLLGVTSANTATFRISVDCHPANMSSTSDFQIQNWTAELKVHALRNMSMNDLQQWVGQNKTPLAFLVPSNSGTADTATANQSRYDLLVQSLATQSKIAIVPLTDQPDRGLVIFATPQSQTQGRSRGRLMAAVCFNCPLPPGNVKPSPAMSGSTNQVPQHTPGSQPQTTPKMPNNPSLPQAAHQASLQAQQALSALSSFTQNQAQSQAQQHQQNAQPYISQHQAQSFQQQQMQQQQQALQHQQHNNQFQYGNSGQSQDQQSQQANQQQQLQSQGNSGQFGAAFAGQNLQQGLSQAGFGQNQIQGNNNNGGQSLPAQPSQRGYLTAQQGQALKERARTYGIHLPPNLDPSTLPPDKLAGVLGALRNAELLKHKNLQAQALAQAQAQAHSQVAQHQQSDDQGFNHNANNGNAGIIANGSNGNGGFNMNQFNIQGLAGQMNNSNNNNMGNGMNMRGNNLTTNGQYLSQ